MLKQRENERRRESSAQIASDGLFRAVQGGARQREKKKKER